MTQKIRTVFVWCFLNLAWIGVSLAQQHAPQTKILNLGTRVIDAFYLPGTSFRTVGLDIRPGEVLTPSYSDGRLQYEIFWRLQSGEIHSAKINLESVLPTPFDGSAIVSIHDDHVEISWAQIAPEWQAYGRIGDPAKFAEPMVPYFRQCAGIVLSNPIAAAAWRSAFGRYEARVSTKSKNIDAESVRKLEDSNRCNLDWYIPRETSNRERPYVDSSTQERLEREWLRQIEERAIGAG